jgi:hypothetical protein
MEHYAQVVLALTIAILQIVVWLAQQTGGRYRYAIEVHDMANSARMPSGRHQLRSTGRPPTATTAIWRPCGVAAVIKA